MIRLPLPKAPAPAHWGPRGREALGPRSQQALPSPYRLRVVRSALALTVVIAAGSLGYVLLGGGRWSVVDCLYMTVITLTTVGFGEVLPVQEVTGGRLYTLVLLFAGMGTVLYFVSAFTAFFVESSVLQVLGKRKRMKALQSISDHVISCGVGKTGLHVVEELVRIGRTCVALDHDPEVIEWLQECYGDRLLATQGDGTSDDDLLRCGIERAQALVVSMGSEVENLYCTLSARQLNPTVHIVVTSNDPKAEQKLRHAGASSVVYSSVIGGQRIASEIVRPNVVSFLDLMMRDPEHTFRFEQIEVPALSKVGGHSLAEAGLRRHAEVLVIATQREGDSRFEYNPGPHHVLRAGDTLIVLGNPEEVRKARKFVTGRG